MSSIANWRGARPEPLHIAIKGDIKPWVWPRGWFYMLVLNECIKPERPLSEALYGKQSGQRQLERKRA